MALQLLSILIFLSIFISGISSDSAILAMSVSVAALGTGFIYLVNKKQKIKFPENFLGMIVFVIILQVYLLFIQNKTNPFFFASEMTLGLCYWLFFYNLKKSDLILRKILIFLSITYAILFIVSVIFSVDILKLAGLFFEYGGKTKHLNIGNLNAIVIVTILAMDWGKIRINTIVIIIINIILLIVSNVRTAVLSLGIGIGYLFYKRNIFIKINKYYTFLLIIAVAGLFVIISLSKSTLHDRPYYLQSIMSFPRHPFGVGVGNFNQIALEYLQNGTDGGLLATTTFNIFFEMLSGIGVFSIIFLIFLYKIFKKTLDKKLKSYALGAIVLTILVNFMFDASYQIPGMIWIFFTALGSFQSSEDLLS